MNDSVAVIVSTYNSPAYLRLVLEGYCHQTRLPGEIIVADDGSTEETAEVVSSFLPRLPVRHVWHEDKGFRLARIRNLGVKASCSDYLIFTDGDCVPHPQFVADHLRHREQGRFVVGKRMLVGVEASPDFSATSFWKIFAMCLKGEMKGVHHLLRIPAVVVERQGVSGIRGCNLALPREAFVQVNGFNEEFIGWGREDAELVARLYNLGLKRKDILFSALVYHLWHPENPRTDLSRNDQLLDGTLGSTAIKCSRGYDSLGED